MSQSWGKQTLSPWRWVQRVGTVYHIVPSVYVVILTHKNTTTEFATTSLGPKYYIKQSHCFSNNDPCHVNWNDCVNFLLRAATSIVIALWPVEGKASFIITYINPYRANSEYICTTNVVPFCGFLLGSRVWQRIDMIAGNLLVLPLSETVVIRAG